MPGVRHAAVPTVPDDGVSPVGTDEWIADHTIVDLIASGLATIAGVITGGRFRTAKQATPANAPSNNVDVYLATAGTGTATPIALQAVDENGVLAHLAGFAILDYRLIAIRAITASPYVPTNGTRKIYVECIGGGGAGGGVATAATNAGAAGGGGGGAYSASWLIPSSASITCAVGAAGTAGAAGANPGNAGGDTTWDTNVIVAKGGSGGLADTVAAGPRVAALGSAGGAAASGTGDIKASGDPGEEGLALAAAQAASGNGGAGAGPLGGGGGADVKAQGAGGTGQAFGGGGAGGCILSGGASVAGGPGGIGLIRVWEFA